MKINVVSISKNDFCNAICQDFVKRSKSFGVQLQLIEVFTPKIAKAQKSSAKEAQDSYTQALLPYLGTHNFALHPQGKSYDSFCFAKLLQDVLEVSFFIGGAYGFGADFLAKTKPISLSALTFSHQIAKLVLCEQIYRGLSINADHPYHK